MARTDPAAPRSELAAAPRTDVLKTQLSGLPAGGRLDVRATVTELPVGWEAGRHRHFYSTVVYVLDGAFQLEVGEQGEQVTVYRAGEAFSELGGVVVNGRALEATRILVVAAREPGKPEAETL
jgi:quercetin dioxygenase-like cupin family protein